jgi:hypothetical protein
LKKILVFSVNKISRFKEVIIWNVNTDRLVRYFFS